MSIKALLEYESLIDKMAKSMLQDVRDHEDRRMAEYILMSEVGPDGSIRQVRRLVETGENLSGEGRNYLFPDNTAYKTQELLRKTQEGRERIAAEEAALAARQALEAKARALGITVEELEDDTRPQRVVEL
jgi:hypothetical protein